MADFKLTISDPKTGLSAQKELKDSGVLIGKMMGEKLDGSQIGLEGYEFEITGGSDYCGFPMRKDIPGIKRKRILSVGGTGIKRKLGKGIKQRKTVCGNTIHENIIQVNLKILKAGKEDLGFKKAEAKEDKKEAKKESPKEEKKSEEKPKEEKKPEVKKEEKKVEEKPKEEAKK